MGLKERIKDFNLRENEGIDKDDKNGKISEAFKPIAETILSGHFKVTKNNSDSYVTVHPTCVEMYYHEEGEEEDKIKDYIVYHRNSDKGKKVSVFSQGVLHNHVSGIDLTFERLVDGLPVRFSALIREFWIVRAIRKKRRVKSTARKTSKHAQNLIQKKDPLTYTRHYTLNILYSMALVCNGLMVMRMKGKRFAA